MSMARGIAFFLIISKLPRYSFLNFYLKRKFAKIYKTKPHDTKCIVGSDVKHKYC